MSKISLAAQAIRDTIVRDVLDDTPLEHKRSLWEASARLIPTPEGVNVRKLCIGGVDCLQCEPDLLTTDWLIVYCHGGGLVEGSAATFRVWTSRLALHTGCRVISIDYSLAPENPYPAAVNEVLSICDALVSNSHSLDKGVKGFCIGADSTGCILALNAMLKLRNAGCNDIKGAFLLSPSIDLTFSGESFEFNANHDPFVSLDVLRHYATLYAGNNDLRNPDISPLFAHFNNFPPTFVMVDDCEILLDDAKRLVSKINESGSTAKLLVSHGLWHVWPAWDEFCESVAALEDIKNHIAACYRQ